MYTEILDQHETLGIDFDGTLVEHPRSAVLQRYIVDHPEKTFYLISFRTHNMRDRIAEHLRNSTIETGVPLTLQHFKAVHCIADVMYEQRNHSLNHAHAYFGWKAKKCQELGCTIMLDDMHETIGPYFHDLGIPCLNPDIYEGHMENTEEDFLIDWLGSTRGQYGECASAALDDLHRKGRIVWYGDQTSTEPHISWPPPNSYCWVALTSEKFRDVRVKTIEVMETEADRWLEQPAMALDHKRPIDLMLGSLEEAIQVEELLGRIEHGVYL